jgi:signal transduction histidine kinase/ligand-binding sensor domain-containing protein/CheY-like chemotaxis protein/AraC-like DNA-binding protein
MKSYYSAKLHAIRALLGVVVWFLFAGNLTAQNERISFRHYTSDQGLSQNRVDGILRDKRGFMWFATYNGLNRFDGYNFLVYKSNPSDTNSLSNNYIYSICEDKYGDLWIGSDEGLNHFLFNENRFVRYFHNPNNSNSISSNKISVLYYDKAGSLWVGTNNGIDKIEFNADKSVKLIHHYKNKNGNVNSLSSNSVTSICEDNERNIWIGTSNGLNKFDWRTGKWTRYYNTLAPNSLSYNAINCIYQDKKGVLWVGTVYGLNRMNNDEQSFTRYYSSSSPNSIVHVSITSITEDNAGNLIFGTLGGLSIYNRALDNFKNYVHRLNDPFGLNNEFVATVYADKFDNVWIGTDKGGVNHYNINQKKFQYFEHDPTKENSLTSNTVNSIYDDGANLWIGTAGGGLNKFNKKTQKFTFYKSGGSSSLSSNFITSIKPDKQQNLWVGTWGGGLSFMKQGSSSFQVFRANSTIKTALINDFVSATLEDAQGNIWVGTLGGLDRYNIKTKAFEHFTFIPGCNKEITAVGYLCFDKQGWLWVGTQFGLFRIQPGTDGTIGLNNSTKADYIVNIPSDRKSISGSYVISILGDSHGNLWFGTYGQGFNKLSSQNIHNPINKLVFERFDESKGLCNNVVYGIQEDELGSLWLSTDNGLARYNPNSLTFRTYTMSDGLQSNQFYWNAFAKAADGKLYFGSMNGLNAFYPSMIKDDKHIPPLAITDLKIYNQSVNVGDVINGRVVLNSSISTSSEIVLSYKHNVFSIEFAALHYAQPEKSKYAYMLEGFDKDWVTTTSDRRFATYTNIRGGNYVFKVKATNNDGLWSEQSFNVRIRIIPPFYTTWWFILFIVISIVILIVLYFKYRTRQLERQKKKLEIQVKNRTAKIEEQKEELRTQADNLIEINLQLEKRKELIEGQKEQLETQNAEISLQRDKLIELNKRVQQANQQKIQFYTNISHEFKTPLTLIIGPIEEILSQWNGDNTIRNRLNLVSRNANRLLHLINQLMEFRKVETGKMDLKLRKADIVQFIRNISFSFTDLAGKRNIDFTVESRLTNFEMWFDAEKIENIIFNLISNAFKYTPENKSISVTINYLPNGVLHASSEKGHKPLNKGYVEINVIDTGIGISQEHQNEIFKRFYRIQSTDNINVKGTGIGLSLVRELVKAHFGTISVESKLGEGSTFCFRLPIDYDFSKVLIADDIADSQRISNIDHLVSLLSNEFNTSSIQAVEAIPADAITKPLILLIEDNADMREYIKGNLQSHYRIIEAVNGREGYLNALNSLPDLIISDVMMPEMSGIELCLKLKSDIKTRHIPIILLSARNNEENYIEGLENGADDYMVKPFVSSILLAKIQNLIALRKKIRNVTNEEVESEHVEKSLKGSDSLFIQKAVQLVENNLSNPNYGVQSLYEDLKISRSLLHKKLSLITGQSATDFITSIRIKKAAALLFEGHITVSEIAYKVGFNDPKYFSRCFKLQMGKTPSEYLLSANKQVNSGNSK